MIVIPGFKYLSVAAGALAGQLQFASTSNVTADIYGAKPTTRTSLAQQYDRAPIVRDHRKNPKGSRKPHYYGHIERSLGR